MEWTSYKSRYTKLTLEKKILLSLLPRLELATFRSRVWCSSQQAIPGLLWKVQLNGSATAKFVCLGVSLKVFLIELASPTKSRTLSQVRKPEQAHCRIADAAAYTTDLTCVQ